MTLAQNHLLPLSGNKHFLATFLLIIFYKMIIACGSAPSPFKETQHILKVDTTTSLNLDSLALEDSIQNAKQFFKEEYNIALLLPLYLDSVNKFYEIDEEPIYPKSLIGIEFYEGILLALDELKTDFSINVNVYDTKKSIVAVEKILLDTSFKKNDLIIGPIYNNTARLVARYAKNNKTPMFAPFSPSTTVTEKNPYYIMLRASIERHCDKIYDFIKHDTARKKLFIIHRDDPFENDISEYFQEIIQADTNGFLAKNDSLIYTFKISFEDQLDSTMLDSTLSEIYQNYIIVPSFNEAFANHALNQFHRFSSIHPSLTFGMPNWDKFHSIRIDNLIELNVHLTKDFIIEDKNPLIKSIQTNYNKKYKGQTEQYCFAAYDLMQYIKLLLEKYGTDFSQHIIDEPADNSIARYNFHYEMILNNENKEEINYIENNHTYLFKFDNFKWINVKDE